MSGKYILKLCIYIIIMYIHVHVYTHICIYKEIYFQELALVITEAGESDICREGLQTGIFQAGADAAIHRWNFFLKCLL